MKQYQYPEWWIELDGTPLGELVDGQWEDMFWVSYRVVPMDYERKKILLDNKLWLTCKFTYRNKKTGELIAHAWAGGSIYDEDWNEKSLEKISMRGLYSMPKENNKNFYFNISKIFRKSFEIFRKILKL